jgi:IclR family pca regulon transcriptional regulator
VTAVDESSPVSVLDGDDVIYVARVPTTRIMSVVIDVGTRFPAYATSLGRVLLAGLAREELDDHLGRVPLEALTCRTIVGRRALRSELDRVRDCGHSVVDQELEDGSRSAAAPLHGADGSVIAAINVSVHASRVGVSDVEKQFVPHVLEVAWRIDADLRPGAR